MSLEKAINAALEAAGEGLMDMGSGCPQTVRTAIANGLSFPEYLWLTVRESAVLQRLNLPDDVCIPEKLVPDEALLEAHKAIKEELARLKAMSESEQAEYGEDRKVIGTANLDAEIATEEEGLRYCAVMLEAVQLWECPTHAHKQLRNTMKKNLTTYADRHQKVLGSKREAREEFQRMAPQKIYDTAVGFLTMRESQIGAEADDMLESVKLNNQWLDQLRESVPVPPPREVKERATEPAAP